ncbi:hypothetical protein glysoja_037720 [Glycine soja]|uniref:Uncharacterized protein n=1 Tax=Glycine soja TaxID=3848 RepID=A0A0B2QM54_GLYSO|nr:hypothetical protein glysoja_037720 [Glycine soja]
MKSRIKLEVIRLPIGTIADIDKGDMEGEGGVRVEDVEEGEVETKEFEWKEFGKVEKRCVIPRGVKVAGVVGVDVGEGGEVKSVVTWFGMLLQIHQHCCLRRRKT